MNNSNSIEVGFFTMSVSLLEKYFPAPFWCVNPECPSLFRPEENGHMRLSQQ